MVRLIQEDFMSNGMFIVYTMRLKTLKDIQNTQGKKFTDWNQLTRYCVQKLKQRMFVQIVDMKTFEMVWLSPEKVDEYTQTGGVLSTNKGSETQ